MDNLLTDFATDISQCKNDGAAWQVGQHFFQSLGFETINYGLMSRQKNVFLGFYTTMDPAWMDHYAECHYDMDDPLIAHCMRHNHAVYYSYKGESELELKGSRQEAKMLSDCYEAGVHSSFLVPVHNDIFPLTGGLNLASRISSKECMVRVERYRHEILVVAALLSSHLAGLPESVKRSKPWFTIHSNGQDLTPREKEVLKWLSLGLRNDRVAQRMNVTSATINFHMGSIKRKLGARTREQALVIAMRKGFIAL